jgi:transcription termination factor Rho
MSVLDRAALEQSPLADLHAIASELSIDGYRRLRRPELIDAILARQVGGIDAAEGGDDTSEPDEDVFAETPVAEEAEDEERSRSRRRRGRRGGRGRAGAREESDEQEAQPEAAGEAAEETAEEEAAEPAVEQEREPVVEGVVELLANGSGFLRTEPPEPSDDDVYISAAQVKRCELVSGDRVAGPRRAPRRSERFASLVRVDTINDQPAAELVSGARFEDLPAAYPEEQFRFGSEDPTLQAIEWQTPFGKGSRVTIVGGPRAGKTQTLRSLAAALAGQEGLQLSVALAGVRPEEITEWSSGPVAPTTAVSLAASADAQDHAVELAVDQGRRIAARGAHAVVLIDGLEGIHPHAARKALAAARRIVDGGSLTVVATAPHSLGGETTVIALDPTLTSIGQFPALDLAASGTIRPELLVGDDGAEAIRSARRAASGG